MSTIRLKEITPSDKCEKCGAALYQGFARCQTLGCGQLREQFKGFEQVVVEKKGLCVESGAITDVRLPNGHYLWAEYFITYLNKGLIDSSCSYTQAYYSDRS